MITLTDEERQRFLAWLHQEWEDSKAIVEQFEKIAAPKVITNDTKAYGVACRLIAGRINSATRETVKA